MSELLAVFCETGCKQKPNDVVGRSIDDIVKARSEMYKSARGVCVDNDMLSSSDLAH